MHVSFGAYESLLQSGKLRHDGHVHQVRCEVSLHPFVEPTAKQVARVSQRDNYFSQRAIHSMTTRASAASTFA